MAMKCLITINMMFCGILGLWWSTKGFMNMILKLLFILIAVADLLMLLYLEGYIIKIAK